MEIIKVNGCYGCVFCDSNMDYDNDTLTYCCVYKRRLYYEGDVTHGDFYIDTEVTVAYEEGHEGDEDYSYDVATPITPNNCPLKSSNVLVEFEDENPKLEF